MSLTRLWKPLIHFLNARSLLEFSKNLIVLPAWDKKFSSVLTHCAVSLTGYLSKCWSCLVQLNSRQSPDQVTVLIYHCGNGKSHWPRTILFPFPTFHSCSAKHPQTVLYNWHTDSSVSLQHILKPSQSPRKWRQYVSLKHLNIWLLHGAATQNTSDWQPLWKPENSFEFLVLYNWSQAMCDLQCFFLHIKL